MDNYIYFTQQYILNTNIHYNIRLYLIQTQQQQQRQQQQQNPYVSLL